MAAAPSEMGEQSSSFNGSAMTRDSMTSSSVTAFLIWLGVNSASGTPAAAKASLITPRASATGRAELTLRKK